MILLLHNYDFYVVIHLFIFYFYTLVLILSFGRLLLNVPMRALPACVYTHAFRQRLGLSDAILPAGP